MNCNANKRNTVVIQTHVVPEIIWFHEIPYQLSEFPEKFLGRNMLWDSSKYKLGATFVTLQGMA